MRKYAQGLHAGLLAAALGFIAVGNRALAAGDESKGSVPNAIQPVSTRPRPAPPNTPFSPIVDFPTFMEHVLTPAANKIWKASGWISNESGVHDLTPHTNEQWEEVVTGAATLAEATNALMIPQRRLDPAWNGLAQKLRAAAQEAYEAAEKHDAKAIADVGERLDEICSACHRHYGYE